MKKENSTPMKSQQPGGGENNNPHLDHQLQSQTQAQHLASTGGKMSNKHAALHARKGSFQN